MMETRKILTVAYVVALLIIAGLAVLTHAVVTQVLHEQEGASEVIDVAGRQRMLSQRIALFATQYEASQSVEDRDRLRDAIDLMARQHQMLVDPVKDTPFDKLRTPAIERLYDTEGLHDLVTGFLTSARAVADNADADASRASALVALATDELLGTLDHAVQMYEMESEAAIQSLTRIQLYALAILLTVLAAEAMLIFRPLVTTVSRQSERLERLAHTDELTDLANRRAFNEQAAREVDRSTRSGSPLSALVLDLDRFKTVNDTHGHNAGDLVLQSCAQAIAGTARSSDISGRTGGEEFCLLMPDTRSDGASKLAERLLERVSTTDISVDESVTLNVTFSGGIAELAEGEQLNDLLRRADLAMYQAKESGRARVSVAEGPTVTDDTA